MAARNLSVMLPLLISILALPVAVWAWSGKEIGLADGDTITVLHKNKPEKIRLFGIDCPEKRQAFGTKIKQFTSDFALGRAGEVQPLGTDR
jgi:endonuclease YncB( thermonuclease family)